MRPGWVSRWLDAFSPSDHEFICCRGDDGGLRGVFPAIVSGNGLKSASNSESPGAGMLVDGEDPAEAIARDVLDRGLHRLELLYMTRGDPDTVGLQKAGTALGYIMSGRTVARSPYLSTAEGWDAFLVRRGTVPFREERRKHRMLERAGHLSFEVSDGSRDLDLLLNQALAIERSGWKGRAHTAIADDLQVLRFYRSIVRWARERGWLRLIFLRLDGQAIAFDLVLQDQRVVYLLKTSYDEALYRFSPGRVLRLLAIRAACDGEVDRYEFLGTDDEYKRKWADDYRERLLLRAFAGTTFGHLEHSAHENAWRVRHNYLGPLKRKIMTEPIVRKVLGRR